MAISELPVSRPIQVPENSTYVVTIDVIVTAETQLAAADRVADLGRRLTEDCGVLDWSFQSLKEEADHRFRLRTTASLGGEWNPNG
jgi:hypothetical protein